VVLGWQEKDAVFVVNEAAILKTSDVMKVKSQAARAQRGQILVTAPPQSPSLSHGTYRDRAAASDCHAATSLYHW
jgi:hypothetical protein